MKQAFALCGLIFIVMYAVALGTLDRPKRDGIVRLRWATDANPARTVQTALFATMYPGEQVTVDPGLGGNDPSKLIVQCATGTGPDLIDVYGLEQMQTLVAAGILLDLTPYARSLGFDPSRTYPALKDGLEVNGKQYRFPCNVNSNCVIYNKKIFDDHGVPYPAPGWSYEDFVRTCKLLLTRPSRSGQTHLAVADWSDLVLFEDMLIGRGGRLFSPDGLHSDLDSPAPVAAMQDLYDMMYVQKVIPTPSEAASMSSQGGWGAGGLNWFSGNKAAMIFIGRWWIVQLPNYPDLRGHLGAVALPHYPGRPSSGVADTRAAGINVKSPHWRDSLKFLQYLASPQYSRVIVQDGDALPPNPQVAASGKALVDDLVPDPSFHEPFVEAIRSARPLDFSPFIDANEVSRWMGEYVEKVTNQLQSPRDALKTLAAQINQQIRINLERRPDLQRRYTSVTGRPYTTNWWRS